jgi:RNA polymerase sigma-70 factor (ECF subfamily)
MCWKTVCEKEQVQSVPARALPIAKDSAKNTATNSVTEEPGFIGRLRAHDATTFRDVVERYQNKVFSFAFHIVGNRDDADTVSVSVFAEFHSSIQLFNAEGAILPFLYRIAIRQCYGYIGNSRSRAPGPATAGASRSGLVDLLSALSEEERVLLLLREMEGYSVDDLTTLFSADENIIRARLLRARQKLIQRNPKDALANY